MTHREYKKNLQPDKDIQQNIIKTNAYVMVKNGEITTEQRDLVIANLQNMWHYWRGCWTPIHSARNAIKAFLGMPKETSKLVRE